VLEKIEQARAEGMTQRTGYTPEELVRAVADRELKKETAR
jgi:hypothetical protein